MKYREKEMKHISGNTTSFYIPTNIYMVTYRQVKNYRKVG